MAPSLGKSSPPGKNFMQLFDAEVTISGKTVKDGEIDPLSLFTGAKFDARLLLNISYVTPTPIQQRAVPYIMEGFDIMGCSQTGSGKTAAFLLPLIQSIIERNDSQSSAPIGVIIVPTRELAAQISTEARQLANGTGVVVDVLYGGNTQDITQNVRITSEGCHILVATPGRLGHFVKDHFCRYLVLDEADEMLNNDFLDDVELLMKQMPDKSKRQTLMFSATFPETIQKLGWTYMKDDFVFIAVGRVGAAAQQIEQKIREVQRLAKKDVLPRLLWKDLESYGGKHKDCYNMKTLVFVADHGAAESVRWMLAEQKFPPCAMMHGDLVQTDREKALNDFKNGICPVLVATPVAGRGLDIFGVDHVVNYDLPKTIDDYVQHIGRTGRVGNRGRATSFFQKGRDDRLAADLIKVLAEAKQEVPAFLMIAATSTTKNIRDDFE